MTAKNDKDSPESPSWRKPFGMILILLIILIWCGVVVSLMDWIEGLNFWLQLPIYLIAGVVWIFPVKPLLLWMNTGRFKA